MIFGKRKDMPVKVETKSEQCPIAGESFMVTLDNIEIFRETPKEENHSPRQFNQNLLGLVCTYLEAEKRVLNHRSPKHT